MAWVKVDDGFPDHPKCLSLSLAAQGLWLVGLCYANRHLTDGWLPAGLLRRAGDAAAEGAAAELTAAGLWVVADGGWRVHQYAEYQRTREQIESTSAARAEAGRRGGRASGKPAGSGAQANGKQAASRAGAGANQKRKEPEREREATGAAGAAAAAPPSTEAYRLFVAMCEETEADEASATRGYRSQQAAIGRQLLDDGHGEEDVRACIRYLRSQSWRTAIIDLRTVASEIGRWAAAGRPAAEAPRAVAARAAGRDEGYGAFVAELDAMLGGAA